ncbi:group III truncated hemoglobin [Cellulophaga sp. E16_2]|uniref:Sec-independent protein translocase protein TatC n=1 Tax=Cellulophaga algicola (strain DSM 14237 / IC166 / ACAM 630) TaxID=688270 RepID=E6XF16_CELAD|nr:MULTISPECIES: group III truncated hemoglobin [Cellulophaga]ADV49238.1 sec-independent protein translocase protein TatC [Cellulophaga algicola DSM 14237]MBO0591704.1 group III truncated hemoglobin [Cellulophaga sp. E16_2]
MLQKEIENRADVSVLVRSFYAKVRVDKVLGPIFNGIITDWETHLELLTDFWETQLFLKRKYHGNPIKAHNEVDKKMNYGVTPEHFGLWLNLWFETIDELFTGDTAFIAKNRARQMNTMLYMKMFENRPK